MSEKLEKLSRMLSQSNLQAVYRVLVSFWDDEQVLLNGGGIKTIIEDPTQWPEIPYVEQLMYLDTMTYLPGDILTKVDRATMHFGLEARVPFLDRRVIEFAAKLPINYKIRDGKGKWILRQILNRHIPTELVERPKKGFDVPIQHWLRKELRDWAEDLLDEKKILDQGLFKPEPIKQKWKQHLEGKRNWENHLWSILMFQAWYETQ